MKLIDEANEILNQLKNNIALLNINQYNCEVEILSNATIGQHTRHIVEIFQQFIIGIEKGCINYDKRERNILIQKNIKYSIETIDEVIRKLKNNNINLNLTTLYHDKMIPTCFERELLYCIEHCIHHQAIIKVGLIYLNINPVGKNFAISKSTKDHKKK